MFGDLLEVNVSRERHGASVDPQDLQSRLSVRNADFDFAIEAARTPQRRIKDLGDVGRADDDDLAARDETIHQAQKLSHHPLLYLAYHFGAFGSHGVDLVDKENRRSMSGCFLEDLAKFGFALAVELPHDLGAV